MNTQEQMLKGDIMKRVLFIYGLKQLPRVFIPKFAVLASLVAVTGFFVSVPNVLRNMPSFFDMPRLFAFLTSAFLNTGLAIQIITVGTVMVFFYMLRDVVKTFQGGTKVLVTA